MDRRMAWATVTWGCRGCRQTYLWMCFDCPVLSLMTTHSLFVLLFVLLLTFPSFFLSTEALLLFVRLQKFLLFLSRSTPINYLNSSLEPPPSILHYFLTANVSAVTLWPLAALLCCPGNLYSTPGFALLSNLYLPSLDIVWRQWSIFMAVLMSSHSCLSLISWGTACRKMNYTTQRTGWMFCSQIEASLPRQDLDLQLAVQPQRWAASILYQLCFPAYFHLC